MDLPESRNLPPLPESWNSSPGAPKPVQDTPSGVIEQAEGQITAQIEQLRAQLKRMQPDNANEGQTEAMRRLLDRVAEECHKTSVALKEHARACLDAGLELEARALSALSVRQARLHLDCLSTTQPIEYPRR